MATLTWVGGGSNLASDRSDWSPSSTPQAGDTLYMDGGTMNVSDNVLPGNTLLIGSTDGTFYAPDTINLSPGTTHLGFDSGVSNPEPGNGPVTVNVPKHSKWSGEFGAGPYGDGVTVQGDGKFENTGTTFVDNQVIIGVPVIGSGSFRSNEAHFTGEKLEFMTSVSSGQNVWVGGYAQYGGQFGTLQVDDPKDFHASVTLSFGEVILEGLKASSYSFQNDMLTLYNGNKPAFHMRMTMDTTSGENGPQDFGVSQVAGAVNVHADSTSYSTRDWASGTLLPVHG